MKKFYIRWTAVTILVLVSAVVISGTIYIKSPQFLEKVLVRVNAIIPGSIQVKTHHLSILRGRIALSDVIIKSPDAVDLAGLEHISLNVALRSLWQKKLIVSKLSVKGPFIDLAMDQKRRLNLINAFLPEKKSSPGKSGGISMIDIEIESFELLKGKIDFKDALKKFFISAGNIQLNARIQLVEKIINADLAIDQLSIDLPRYTKIFKQVQLNASLENQHLAVSRLAIFTNDSSLRFSGNVDDLFEKPLVDINCHIDLELAELNHLIGKKVYMKGRVEGNAFFKGEPLNPETSAKLSYSGGTIFTLPFENVTIDAWMKDRFITIQRVDAGLYKGNTTITGMVDLNTGSPSGSFLSGVKIDDIYYDLDLVTEKLKPSFIPFVAMDKNLRLKGSAKLKGKGILLRGVDTTLDLNLTNDTQGKGKEGASSSRLVCSAKAALKKGALHFRPFDFKFGSHKADISGAWDIRKNTVDLVVDLTTPEFQEYLKPFNIGLIKGSGQINLEAKGEITHPDVMFSASGSDIEIRDYHLGTVGISLKGNPLGRLTLESFKVSHKGAAIEGHGVVDGVMNISNDQMHSPLDLSLSLSQVTPSHFYKKSDITGKISGDLRVQGRIFDPFISFALRGKNVGHPAFQFGDVMAKFSLDQGCLKVNSLSAKNNQSVLNISGDLELFSESDIRKIQKNPEFQLLIDGKTLFLEDFLSEHRGKVRILADLNGTFDDIIGTIEVDGGPFILFDQYLEAVHLKSDLHSNTLFLNDFRAKLKPDQTISARGYYQFFEGHPFDITVKGKDIAISEIRAISANYPASGKMQFDLNGSGSLIDPKINASVFLTDLFLKKQSFDRARLDLSYRQKKLTVKVDNPFQLDGTYDVATGEIDSTVIFKKTDLEPYFAFAGLRNFSGKVNGELSLKGNSKNVGGWNVYASMTDLKLNYQEIPFASVGALHAKLESQKLKVPKFKIKVLDEGYLWLHGKGDLDKDIAFKLEGLIPAKAVEPFLDDISDVKGTVRIISDITGKISRPEIKLDVILEDIGGQVYPLTHTIKAMKGRILLTPEALSFDGIQGEMGSGSFYLSGVTKLSTYYPTYMDLKLSTKSFPVEISDMLRVVFHSDVTLRGDLKQSYLEGQIQLIEGLYDKNFKINLAETLNTENWKRSPRPPKRRESPFGFVSLNVKIIPINSFLVDNNYAYLDITPDLHLRGTLATPVINGQAKVADGRIYYRKHEFVVNRGVVDFVDPYTTRPVIDIQADYEIRDWKIDLSISGTPENLSFNLSSVPEEEYNDIVSLILIGKTTQELIQKEGGTTSSPQQMLASIVASTFSDGIKQRTGIDTLELETGDDQDPEATDRIKVTVGKQLSKRLTLKYALESKNGEMNQRAISEYQFLDHILANSYQDTNGAFGGKLLFRIEFR